MYAFRFHRSGVPYGHGRPRRRLTAAAAGLALSCAVAGVVHLHARRDPTEQVALLPAPPGATPAAPASLPVRAAIPTAGLPGPAGFSFDGGFWRLLNNDTAVTTRGQYAIVRDLSDAIGREIRGMISSSDRRGGGP